MPKGLIEGLLTFLGILFFFVLPMIARARGAARRNLQLGGLPLRPPGRPRAPAPEVTEEEAEEEPATAAVPMPAPAIPAAPQPPPAVPGREWASRPPAAALAAPDGPQRLRRLTPWQRAVVWAEILGPPRSLQ